MLTIWTALQMGRIYFTGTQNNAPNYMNSNDVHAIKYDGDSRRKNEK